VAGTGQHFDRAERKRRSAREESWLVVQKIRVLRDGSEGHDGEAAWRRRLDNEQELE